MYSEPESPLDHNLKRLDTLDRDQITHLVEDEAFKLDTDIDSLF